jgi:hypothetical protein
MGVRDLWKIVQKKGHDPPVVSMPREVPGGKLLVDIQGTLYGLLRRAYSNHDDDEAQRIFLHGLEKLFVPTTCVLYFDGERAEEKSRVHAQRDQTRKSALAKATTHIQQLEARIDMEQRVPRQLHIDIRKSLDQCFVWTPISRQGLCAFLRSKGWTVKVCITEADIGIALDCTAKDVIVSRDSDMLAYR